MMTKQLIYDGAVIRVVTLENRWEVVEHVPAVTVLVLREHHGVDEVLMVEQERPAIGQRTWELPAGLVDAGEGALEAAKRELAEEVSLGGTLRPICEVHSSPGFCTEKVTLFEATDTFAAHLEGDEHEDLVVAWKPLRDIYVQIASGERASSAHTLLGLTYALGKRGALP